MTRSCALTRRAVLAAGLLTAAELAGCGGTTLASGSPRAALSGSFDSEAQLGVEVSWKVLTADGRAPEGLPVVVFLHGKNGDHAMVDYWADGLAAHVAGGGTPLAVAAVDCGNTYYHPRITGEDAGAMVTEEFVPLLSDRGLDTTRLALAGISMGGYGSLRLAGLLGPDRVRAVTVASPALWREPASYAAGAFDSARDHAQHNVFGKQSDLAGVHLRVDCGLADPFLAATRDYVSEFTTAARPAHSFTEGGHNVDYWRTLVPEQLALLSRSLS